EYDKGKAPSGKGKAKSTKKKKDDDDPDEDLQAWIKFKTKMKKDGICPFTSTNDDLDNDTADMLSQVSRTMEVTQSWLARCPADRRQKVSSCIEQVNDAAKKICLHLAVRALATIRGQSP